MRAAVVAFAATWSVAVAVACALGCAGAAPKSGDSPEAAAAARIHRTKCGACHTPIEPGTRSRETLEAALAKHRKRVRLSEGEWSAMVDYLASDAPPGGAPAAP